MEHEQTGHEQEHPGQAGRPRPRPRSGPETGAPEPSGKTQPSHLREALRLAREAAADGGGPFGAVVARGDTILGRGANRVVANADPTAHAEVVALRDAARALGTHDLAGCVLYTSCEPCPMCLGAAWWARVERVVFAADRADAAAAGFDDEALYREMARPLGERELPVERLLAGEGGGPFEVWANNPDSVPY